MKSISYQHGLLKRLRTKKYALGLLQHAFEESCRDGNWEAFGLILEDIIEAQGSKKEFAQKAKVSRQHLYRLFGKKVNPTLATLLPVLSELGFRLMIAQTAARQKKIA